MDEIQMTPMEYGTTGACEFIGGPMDGLSMRVKHSTCGVRFDCYARERVAIWSCGIPVMTVPWYNRVGDRRFQFVGYHDYDSME